MLQVLAQAFKNSISPTWYQNASEQLILKKNASASEQLVSLKRTELKAKNETLKPLLDSTNRLASQLQLSNDSLRGISQDVANLGKLVLALARSTDSHLSTINEGIAKGFKSASISLMAIDKSIQKNSEIAQKTLDELEVISEALLTPYEIQVRELRQRAEKLLERAFVSTDYRAKNLKASRELFHDTIKSKIGREDYSAWFGLGLLNYCFDPQNLDVALKCFDESLRTSQNYDQKEYVLLSIVFMTRIEFDKSNYNRAKFYIDKARKLGQKSRVLTFLEAACYYKQGEPEKCLSQLLVAINEDLSIYYDVLADLTEERYFSHQIVDKLNQALVQQTKSEIDDLVVKFQAQYKKFAKINIEGYDLIINCSHKVNSRSLQTDKTLIKR